MFVRFNTFFINFGINFLKLQPLIGFLTIEYIVDGNISVLIILISLFRLMHIFNLSSHLIYNKNKLERTNFKKYTK